MAGKRQVKNVKFALQHNIGLGGAVVVGIYKLGFPEAFKPYPSNKPNPAIDPNAFLSIPSSVPQVASTTSTSPSSGFKAVAVFDGLTKQISGILFFFFLMKKNIHCFSEF